MVPRRHGAAALAAHRRRQRGPVSHGAGGRPGSTPPSDPGFFAAAHGWTAGRRRAVVGDEELTGGDFVRTMKQLIDLARQVAIVPRRRHRLAPSPTRWPNGAAGGSSPTGRCRQGDGRRTRRGVGRGSLDAAPRCCRRHVRSTTVAGAIWRERGPSGRGPRWRSSSVTRSAERHCPDEARADRPDRGARSTVAV